MESWYGSAQDICLTKDILTKVLTYLRPNEWCKLKLNSKLLGLMKLCQNLMPESEASVHIYVESLGKISVRFENICKYGSPKLVQKFVGGRKLGLIGFKSNNEELYLINICVSIFSKDGTLPMHQSQFTEQVTNNMDHCLRGACASGNLDIVEYVLRLFKELSSTAIKLSDARVFSNDLVANAMIGAVICTMSMSYRMPLDRIYELDFYITGCVSAIVHNYLHIFIHLLNKITEINPASGEQDCLDSLLTLSCQYRRTAFCEVLADYNLKCNNIVHYH